MMVVMGEVWKTRALIKKKILLLYPLLMPKTKEWRFLPINSCKDHLPVPGAKNYNVYHLMINDADVPSCELNYTLFGWILSALLKLWDILGSVPVHWHPHQ